MNNNTPHDESGNPPPGQSTCKDRIDDLLARIEEDIDHLDEGRRIDELSANEIEQSIARLWSLKVRLLALLLKVETDKAESNTEWSKLISEVSIIGEPKITPGKPTPVRVAIPEDDED